MSDTTTKREALEELVRSNPVVVAVERELGERPCTVGNVMAALGGAGYAVLPRWAAHDIVERMLPLTDDEVAARQKLLDVIGPVHAFEDDGQGRCGALTDDRPCGLRAFRHATPPDDQGR